MADLIDLLGSLFVPAAAPASSSPVAAPTHAPVMAYETYDLSSIESSAELASFLRGGLASLAGKPVTEASAMGNATFNRAVTVTASTIGHLPLNLFRRNAAGDIEKAKDHPVHRLLRVRPNAAQTPYQFKSYMQGRALLKGDAFAFIVPGVRGAQALWPLDPDRVTVEQAADFSLTYRYDPPKGGERVYQASQIMHLRAPWSADGIRGVGLLKMAKEALGLANVSDEAAARLLKNGSYVGGVLEHPGKLGPQAIVNLRQQFEERHAGVENSGKWLVTEEGMKVTPLGASGKDAEGLAQRKHQAEEVSRFTGVPRPLLMFDETSWGSGIEQLGLFFVTYCLLPWFNAWEEAGAAALLTDAERETHYLKFNEAALLRGSLKDQAEFLSKALGGPGQGGFMLPDEAREKMDMNRMDHPAGQRPAWVQENTTNAP